MVRYLFNDQTHHRNINGNLCRSMLSNGNDLTKDNSLGRPEVEDQPEVIQDDTIEGKVHLEYKKKLVHDTQQFMNNLLCFVLLFENC